MTERITAVGVFTERSLADDAIEELRNAGFKSDQIGFVSPDRDTTAAVAPVAPLIGTGPAGTTMGGPAPIAPVYVPTDETAIPGESKAGATATGAVSGGVIGGVLGAVAALLIPGFGPAIAGGILAAVLGGVAIGAVAGGLIGALTSIGVPEDEARFYQDELNAGRTLVTVKADNRYDEALGILRHNGAYDATTRPATTDNYVANQPVEHNVEDQPTDAPYTNPDAQPGVPPAQVDRNADYEIREPNVPPITRNTDERTGPNNPSPPYGL